uniref:Uncharacterized protein n=1 Tax=Steinernema glaseri TaxID=37863 RepID=A0A1I7YD36_9BILA
MMQRNRTLRFGNLLENKPTRALPVQWIPESLFARLSVGRRSGVGLPSEGRGVEKFVQMRCLLNERAHQRRQKVASWGFVPRRPC